MIFAEMGKWLIFFGLLIVIFGLILTFGRKIPYLGRLPGDIVFQRGNFHFYLPLTTSLLISLIFTFIFWIIQILRRTL